MTQPQKSMDGFVPRRSGTPLNRYQELSSTHTKTLRDSSRPGLERTPLRTTEPVLPKTDVGTLERSHDLGGLTRTDIDESLRELDENPPVEKKRSKGLA